MSEVVGHDAITSGGDGIIYLEDRKLLQSVFSFLTDKDRLELALTCKSHWKEVEKCSKKLLTTISNLHRTDADWDARVLERLGMGVGNDQAASCIGKLWAAKRVYLRIVADNNAEEENSDEEGSQDDDSCDSSLSEATVNVTAMAVSPTGNFIAIGTSQGIVEVWNSLSKTCRRFTHSPFGNSVHGVLMVNDGLVVSCSKKRICVWSVTNEGHWKWAFLYETIDSKRRIDSWTFDGTVAYFVEETNNKSSCAVKSLQLQQEFTVDTKFSGVNANAISAEWQPILFQIQNSIFLLWKSLNGLRHTRAFFTGERASIIEGSVYHCTSGRVETLVSDVSPAKRRQATNRVRVSDSFYLSNGFDPEVREGTFSIVQEGSEPEDEDPNSEWLPRVPFRAGISDEPDDQATPKRFLSFPYGMMGESVVAIAHPAAETEVSENEISSSSDSQKQHHGNEIYVAGGDHSVVVAYLLDEPRL